MFGVVSKQLAQILDGEEEAVRAELLAEVGRQTASLAVEKMIKYDRTFSICTMEDACKAVGQQIPWDVYAVLRPVHCVEWQLMGRDLRAKVQALCRFVINQEGP